MRDRRQLLRAPRVEGIEPVEHPCEAGSVGAALREFPAGGRAVALIRAAGVEQPAATWARNAVGTRAHALWHAFDGWLRPSGGGP